MTDPLLSSRLRAETRDWHDRMETLMQRADVFASRLNYGRFTTAQYLFQQDVEAFFDDPRLQQAVPDLQVRGRLEAARQDLLDLEQPIPPQLPQTRHVTMPSALGWLYVSEGSTLGAAFLFNEAKEKLGLSADFGARNLAAYPEGRARVWRRFIASLDEQPAGDHGSIVQGARSAYARFEALLLASTSQPT